MSTTVIARNIEYSAAILSLVVFKGVEHISTLLNCNDALIRTLELARKQIGHTVFKQAHVDVRFQECVQDYNWNNI